MQVLLLHGFTGAPESFLSLVDALPNACDVVAPALPGHTGLGIRNSAERVRSAWRDAATRPNFDPDWDSAASFEECIDVLADALDGIGFSQGLVCGYSLGGRMTLGLLCRHPRLARRAIVVGAHPGLDEPDERAARRTADSRWVQLLLQDNIEEFVERWERTPVLDTAGRVSEAELAAQRALRLRHRPAGLVRSLETLGLGEMPSWRRDLERIRCPVTFVSGALDTKFTTLAREMATLVPGAQQLQIDACGHNPVLERPQYLADVITRQLS